MSFLGSLLSPALTAATTIAGDYQGAQAQANKQQQQGFLQQLALQRQQQQDALKDDLTRSQTSHFNAETLKLGQPTTPKRVYDPARGVTVNEEDSTSTPVAGLPEMPIKAKYTPKSFVENGQPVEGLVDEEGNYLHADRTPTKGRITPFTPPQKDAAPKFQLIKDDATGKYYRARVDGPEGPVEASFTRPGGNTAQGAQTSLPDLLRTHRSMKATEQPDDFGVSGADEAQEALDYAKKHGMTTPDATTPLVTGASAIMNMVHAPNDAAITYLQNSRAFGEDASQAMKGRTNEERVRRDIANSRIDRMNAKLPGAKQAVQDRRANIIGMAALANPEQLKNLIPSDRAEVEQYMRGAGGSPSESHVTQATPLQQAWDAAAKLHGVAKTIQEIGERP